MADLPNKQNTGDVTLYNELGNPVAIVIDGSIYRLATTNIITNAGGTKVVDVVTDGAIERLAVDVNGENGVVLEKFFPHIEYEADTPVVLSDITESTLFSVSDVGKLDFIAISGSRSDYVVILEVDAIEVMRISMSQLGSDLGLSAQAGAVLPIYTTTANKNFRMLFAEGADFSTSFAIKVIKTSVQAVEVTWLIKWRDQS